MKACRTCGRVHRSAVKHRSSIKPVTKADKSLSIKHLHDSIDYNKRHISDHKKIERSGGSKKYNESHIKAHEKAMKKDKKLLEDRKSEGVKPQYRTANKLLRGMRGYKR